MSNGTELYLDSKYQEFEHRVNEGPVVSPPKKYNTGVKEGDTLYFHHHVVTQHGQPITGEKNHYFVLYDDKQAMMNQAICYKDKDTGEIHPLFGWTILEEIEKKEEEKKGLIEVVKLKEELLTKAKIAFESDFTRDNGLKIGDIIGIPKKANYRFKIDDKTYFRTRNEDLLYVEEQV